MYYNTTLEQFGVDKYTIKTANQEKKILTYMVEHPFSSVTSEDLSNIFPAKTPSTSIRRALCDLKREGKISICGNRIGQYNRPIFEYAIN